MLKDRNYDVTPHIILILSLTCTSKWAGGVGERLRGVLWRWVLVGVVGVRSQWVGGGDPLENWNLIIGWAMADSYVYDLGMVVCARGWPNLWQRRPQRFTALVYATFRSLQPHHPAWRHRSRVTPHLPADTRDRAWNFPYNESNGWILLSDSDQSEESRGLVGLSSARSSRFAQSEEGICWPIRGEYMLTNQCERARDSTNQSSPPGMQRAVGYKMHCSFVSPIPFNYAVQKRRRLVWES